MSTTDLDNLLEMSAFPADPHRRPFAAQLCTRFSLSLITPYSLTALNTPPCLRPTPLLVLLAQAQGGDLQMGSSTNHLCLRW